MVKYLDFTASSGRAIEREYSHTNIPVRHSLNRLEYVHTDAHSSKASGIYNEKDLDGMSKMLSNTPLKHAASRKSQVTGRSIPIFEMQTPRSKQKRCNSMLSLSSSKKSHLLKHRVRLQPGDIKRFIASDLHRNPGSKIGDFVSRNGAKSVELGHFGKASGLGRQGLQDLMQRDLQREMVVSSFSDMMWDHGSRAMSLSNSSADGLSQVSSRRSSGSGAYLALPAVIQAPGFVSGHCGNDEDQGDGAVDDEAHGYIQEDSTSFDSRSSSVMFSRDEAMQLIPQVNGINATAEPLQTHHKSQSSIVALGLREDEDDLVLPLNNGPGAQSIETSTNAEKSNTIDVTLQTKATHTIAPPQPQKEKKAVGFSRATDDDSFEAPGKQRMHRPPTPAQILPNENAGDSELQGQAPYVTHICEDVDGMGRIKGIDHLRQSLSVDPTSRVYEQDMSVNSSAAGVIAPLVPADSRLQKSVSREQALDLDRRRAAIDMVIASVDEDNNQVLKSMQAQKSMFKSARNAVETLPPSSNRLKHIIESKAREKSGLKVTLASGSNIEEYRAINDPFFTGVLKQQGKSPIVKYDESMIVPPLQCNTDFKVQYNVDTLVEAGWPEDLVRRALQQPKSSCSSSMSLPFSLPESQAVHGASLASPSGGIASRDRRQLSGKVNPAAFSGRRESSQHLSVLSTSQHSGQVDNAFVSPQTSESLKSRNSSSSPFSSKNAPGRGFKPQMKVAVSSDMLLPKSNGGVSPAAMKFDRGASSPFKNEVQREMPWESQSLLTGEAAPSPGLYDPPAGGRADFMNRTVVLTTGKTQFHSKSIRSSDAQLAAAMTKSAMMADHSPSHPDWKDTISKMPFGVSSMNSKDKRTIGVPNDQIWKNDEPKSRGSSRQGRRHGKQSSRMAYGDADAVGLSRMGIEALKGVSAPDIVPYGAEDHVSVLPRQLKLLALARERLKENGGPLRDNASK